MTTLRDPASPVKPGDVLGGKFRVERVLGEGGMGVVAAATHLKLGQLVALKFMLPVAMKHPENVARFEREARAAVRLRSDHVAKVSDVGHLDGGEPYIVMEYLEGEDLDAMVERGGPLPVAGAVDYVLQACEAVAEAHSLGIVHRDLKPKNLFLTRRLSGKPLVKVLDFGISKSMNEAADLSLTSTTQHLGSPSYMSPEQLRSARDVDARTDIWALGVILQELLTGQVPFLADTVTLLTVKVLEEPPTPIGELRPDVPPALAAAVAKCLEKKREDRFQTVLELAQAIAPFASADGAAKAAELLAPTSGRSSHERVAPPDPISFRLVREGSSTNSAWDRTQLAPASGARRGALAAALGAFLLAGAVAGFVAVRRTGAGSATPVTTQAATAATISAAAATPAAPPSDPPPVRTAAEVAGDPPAPTTPSATTHPPRAPTGASPVHAARDAGMMTPQPVLDAGGAAAPAGTFHLPNVRN